jgi:hypothetical protein
MMAPLTSEQSQLEREPLEGILEIGSLVYVTSYGPYRGLKGIIRTVDALSPANISSCFYLIALQEGHVKEPVWFVHDDVAAVEGQNVSQWRPIMKEQAHKD